MRARLFLLALCVAASSWSGANDNAFGAASELDSIRALIRENRVEEAIGHVGSLTTFDDLISVRTLNEFAPLRSNPMAEALLKIEDFGSREIAALKSQSENDPKNLRPRYLYLRALKNHGHFDEAVEAARQTLNDLSMYDQSPQAEAQIRDVLYKALVNRGEERAADAAFQPLLRLDPKSEKYVVNNLINYSLVLMYEGRYEVAIRTVTVANGEINGLGQSLLRYVLACSQYKSGNQKAAYATINASIKMKGLAPFPFVRTYLCLDRPDAAAQVMAQILMKDQNKNRFFELFHDCSFGPDLPQGFVEQYKNLLALRNYGVVKREIDKMGVIVDLHEPCTI